MSSKLKSTYETLQVLIHAGVYKRADMWRKK